MYTHIRLEVKSFHEIGCISVSATLIGHTDIMTRGSSLRTVKCPQNYPLPTKDSPLHLLFRASIITLFASSFLTFQLPDWCWVWGFPNQKAKRKKTTKTVTILSSMKCRINEVFTKNILFIYFLEGGKQQCVVAPPQPPLGTWPATQACALTGNRISDPLVHSPRSVHWATPAGFQLQF